MRKLVPHLAIAALLVFLLLPLYSSSTIYAADDAGAVTVPPFDPDAGPVRGELAGSGIQPGCGSAVTPPVTPPAPSSPAVTADSDDATLAKTLYGAIQSKDWFLAVGAALALLIHGALWLLRKKWARFEKDRWGLAVAAALAGLVALSTAWLAGKDVADARNLVGAVKIFGAALATFLSTKKLASDK